jgi:Na+/proline symporter
VNKGWALAAACGISLTYSLLAGFWGVVITDLVQFAMAMIGAIALAVIAWSAVGGGDALVAASRAGAAFDPDTLRFLPTPGEGGFLDLSWWTQPFTVIAAYLGMYWWASEGIDGSGVAVQRILASKDDRHGMLASLWYNVAHYALRPWPWICVALASLLVLPHREVVAERAGEVRAVSETSIVLVETAASPHAGASEVEHDLAGFGDPSGWVPLPRVKAGDAVAPGDVLAATDSERAYVVMMTRYLPLGLLGLVVASLLAAFMSTIDTHVNLAASFFVNDVYRRFLVRTASAVHYVRAAQAASVGVMAIGGYLAYVNDSISGLFLFYLSVLAGVGPVYVLRWLWWRVKASTEVTAIIASSTATFFLTWLRKQGVEFPETPLSRDGVLSAEGRHLLVTLFSATCAFGAILIAKRPDPASLVAFYRRVRPMGWWGPVRALAPDVERPREGAPIAVGVISGLCAIYGPMLGLGWFLLGRRAEAAIAGMVMLSGIVGVRWALSQLSTTRAD